MSKPRIGHNSGMTQFETAADLPPDMPKMHYFRCDIQALRKVLYDKPLDIRGAFISALLAMYEHMEPLPADDAQARLRLGINDARVYRRVRDELERLGLIYKRASGRYSNHRFEEEIAAYVTEFKNRREAALDRERKAREYRQRQEIERLTKPELTPSYGLAKPQLGVSLAIVNAELTGNEPEKINKNNERNTAIEPERAPQGYHEDRLHARVTRVISSEDKGESESLSQTQNPVEPLSETGVSDVGKPRRYSDQFETFWSGYPDKRNNSRVMAWQAWQRLPAADRAAAVASLPHFARYCHENPDYRPVHAERYLKQRRFESHSGAVANLATSPGAARAWWQNPTTVAGITPERWRKAIAQYANGVWPVDKLGPPPGSPGCVVPADVVTELRLTETYDPAGVRRGYTPGGATT